MKPGTLRAAGILLLLIAVSFPAPLRAATTWEAIPDPYEGPVSCFAEGPDGVVWAGSIGSGVFKSADGGDTWSSVNAGLTCATVNDLVVTPAGDAFAATAGGGVYKLPKGADAWQQVNAGIPPLWPSKDNRIVYRLALHPSGDLFVSEWQGVVYRLPAGGSAWVKTATPPLRSLTLALGKGGRLWFGSCWTEDKGDTWKQASPPAARAGVYNCAAVDDRNGIVYLGGRPEKYGRGGGGVFVSSDEGKTWTQPASVPVTEEIRGIVVSGDKVFACTKTTSDIDNKVFVSADKGQTWTRATKGLESLCATVGIAATKNGTLFLGANGAFRSKDGGATWQKLAKLEAKRPCTSLVVTPDGDLYMSSFLLHITCHGVARYRAGAWTELNDGLSSWGLTCLGLNKLGEVLTADRIRCSYRLKGNGNTWTRSNVNQSFGANCIGLAADKKVILGAYPSGGGSAFLISDDDGSTFVPTWNTPAARFPQVWDIVVAPDGTIAMTTEQAAECEISTDGGKTHVNIGPSKGADGGTIGVSPDGTILMCMLDMGVFAYDGGRAPGGKWVRSQEGMETTRVSKFALNNDRTKVFAATGKGVFVSADGKVWKALDGLPVLETRTIAFDAQGRLYVGTMSGIYRTTSPQ